jgi:3-keto steroid reductase
VYASLHPNPLEDYQLLEDTRSYAASKYMGDLVMLQLDRTFSESESQSAGNVRCLIAEPGGLATNVYNGGLGSTVWIQTIQWIGYFASLYFVSRQGFLLYAPDHEYENKFSAVLLARSSSRGGIP